MKGKKELRFTCGMALLLLWLEAITIRIVVHEQASWGWILLVHATICFFIISRVKKRADLGADMRFPYIGLMLSFFLGPPGAILTLFAAFFYWLHRRSRKNWSGLLEELFPHETGMGKLGLLQRILLGWEKGGSGGLEASYGEIMGSGTVFQKRAALEKILDHFQPRFLPILKEALNDPANAIRVQSATVFRTLEDQFASRYEELKRRITEKASEPYEKLAFARHCSTYANSKLLSEEKENEMRKEAIEIYKKYLQEESNNSVAHLELARLYLLDGEREKSMKIAEESLKKDGKGSSEAHLLKLECLFQEKKYEEMRAVADLCTPQSVMEKELVCPWQTKEHQDAKAI